MNLLIYFMYCLSLSIHRLPTTSTTQPARRITTSIAFQRSLGSDGQLVILKNDVWFEAERVHQTEYYGIAVATGANRVRFLGNPTVGDRVRFLDARWVEGGSLITIFLEDGNTYVADVCGNRSEGMNPTLLTLPADMQLVLKALVSGSRVDSDESVVLTDDEHGWKWKFVIGPHDHHWTRVAQPTTLPFKVVYSGEGQ